MEVTTNQTENLRIDINKGIEVAGILFDKFNSGAGIFGHNSMPEDLYWGADSSGAGMADTPPAQMIFITLVASLDYMRNADKLWEAGRETMLDGQTNWLFVPDEVHKRGVDEVAEAMKRHRLCQRPHKDSRIWKRVSDSLALQYKGDPKRLVEECDHDAKKLYDRKYDIRFKKMFPSLSGDKIFPVWIRMLHDNARLSLKNLDEVPIPVDVHIARATFATGCLRGTYVGSIAGVSSRISEAWDGIVSELKHPTLKYALQMDESLWNLSKYGCRHRKIDVCPNKEGCPVGNLCTNGQVLFSSQEIRIKT